MKKKILFIERQQSDLISIERVFKQVALSINADEFETSFQNAPYGNNLSGIIKNLLFFRKRPADVYHITGQIHFMAFVLSRDKTVLTVHDVRFMHIQKGLKRFVMKKLLLDWPVKKLRYLTTISEATKKEIISFTGCDERKIRVIQNPLFHNIATGQKKEFDATCPVILQVGTLEYKNLSNLIPALSGIKCKLRIIGKLDETHLSLLHEHKIDFENRWELTESEIRTEYEQADIVTLCSTAEGFGLPVIEGQAMGKPTITSDLSPMKEVAGGAAHLVDPNDPQQIHDGILKIINDESYRQTLIAAGFENVKRFEPRRIAAAYENLYDEIINRDKI